MNNQKRILIVSRSFYPINSPRSFRTTELAKELARQGHDVQVLLPKNLENEIKGHFRNDYEIQFLYYGPLKWKPLKKSKFLGDITRKFGRLLFLLFEYPNIEIYFKLPKLLKKLNGFDLLISIAVPHENHWAVAEVRNKRNPIAKTWVADCGDPFMNSALETISPPFYFGWLENRFLKKADYISVPSQGSLKAYDHRYSNKFKVIPQGFNLDEVELSEYKLSSKKKVFAYAGGVTKRGVRSLHNVIDVLLEQNKEFTFHIYSSNGKSVLKDYVKGHEDKFVLHAPLDRLTLLKRLSEMDFLVNLDNNTPFNTPSKLIDYSLCRRPILNLNPYNPNKEIISSFLEGDYREKYVVNNMEQYNIKEVVKKFLSCCD